MYFLINIFDRMKRVRKITKMSLDELARISMIILLTVVSIIGLQANEIDSLRVVSGVVFDQFNQLLPGVTVTVKGTGAGVSSDLSGKFSLKVPEGAILQFSFIGYETKEVAVGDQQIINVVMDDSITENVLTPAKHMDLSVKQSLMAKSGNNFAFKMFREISVVEVENTFFSPLSLNLIMGLLYNGASGNTRNQIGRSMGITDFEIAEINEFYQKILQILPATDPTTDLQIANSIWYHYQIPVKESFIYNGEVYFDAKVKALDFSDNDAAQLINAWCAEKTNGKINRIVDSPMPDDIGLYLLNALYFKSKWQIDKRFNKANTKLDYFTKADNQKKEVNLMEQTTNLQYYADEYLQCIELPYGNEAFSMSIVLPSEGMSVSQLIEHLDNDRWDKINNNMSQQRVWLKLPRFKLECDFSLKQPLINMGMDRMFYSGFANISDFPTSVSNIRQKTFVEVNEEGAEAAVVTIAEIVVALGTLRAPEPVRFFADRPFLFLIKENSSGVILFIGRIDDPSS